MNWQAMVAELVRAAREVASCEVRGGTISPTHGNTLDLAGQDDPIDMSHALDRLRGAVRAIDEWSNEPAQASECHVPTWGEHVDGALKAHDARLRGLEARMREVEKR